MADDPVRIVQFWQAVERTVFFSVISVSAIAVLALLIALPLPPDVA